MQIKFLKAGNGDSIWISFLENDIPRNILVDGGTSTTYTYKDKKDGKIKDGDLKKLIDCIKHRGEKLDLVILTHIDDDHIDGFLKWFSKDETAIQNIKEVWFNSGKTIKKFLIDTESEVEPLKFKEETTFTSVIQGVDFENYIRDKEIWNERVIKQGDIIDWNAISFQMLSPGKEKLEQLLKEWKKKVPESLLDTSRKDDYKKTLKKLVQEDVFEEDKDAYNGSSIAFILKNDGKNYLLLGDSHPSEIVIALKNLGYNKDNKLNVELFKLSHHGSQKNTSTELLNLIETNNYVVSTNGELHNHPDKTTIARIVRDNPNAKIYFNYSNLISKLILEEDKTDYPNVEFLDTESL